MGLCQCQTNLYLLCLGQLWDEQDSKTRGSEVRVRRRLRRVQKKDQHAAQLRVGKRHADALRCYQDAHLVITTGGTYLVENYPPIARLRQFKIDHLLGKSPIFFTQSLGPFM
jgi:colanic acid/amylovoran biosynthesis protein